MRTVTAVTAAMLIVFAAVSAQGRPAGVIVEMEDYVSRTPDDGSFAEVTNEAFASRRRVVFKFYPEGHVVYRFTTDRAGTWSIWLRYGARNEMTLRVAVDPGDEPDWRSVRLPATGGYVGDAEVKVIGSQNANFVSGRSDLRGVFVADGIRGTATVIARDRAGNFAFYRGKEFLGKRPVRVRRPSAQPGKVDYLSNVLKTNAMLQGKRGGQQRDLFQREQMGVQVQQMY